ncbi:hypothetical protein GQ472_02450 [archaeon]|nr:hypothetical protein [archaeon]
MSDEKTPAIDNLITTNQYMLDLSKQVREFYNQAITFENRSHDSADVYSFTIAKDGYDLRVADFPSSLFNHWYSPQKNKSFESVENLIVKTLTDSLMLEDSATVFLGKDTVSVNGLYAAWKMFPDIRDNTYLVIMQGVGSTNVFSWFLEGDLDKYSAACGSEGMEIVEISLDDYGKLYKERTKKSL